MKISISYPPLTSEKGVPLLSQNRQFQWFKSPTYVYPVVPAYMATLLKNEGFEVFWDDGIAEGISYSEWLARLKRERPDVIVLESKTPVIQRHWRIIEDIKQSETGGWQPATVLVGDHVTALPEESMNGSEVDYVVTGGDYDFSMVSLCRFLAKAGDTGRSPQGMSELEGGIWYRHYGKVRNSGAFALTHDVSQLPPIDRNLTRWKLYAYKNGNFKYTPGAYVMAARDCWWGKCTFCSWTTLYPPGSYRVTGIEQHLNEIGSLIDDLNVREIFDDSGCFPKGRWLEEFCNGMIERGYHRRVTLGCNTRVNAQTPEQFRLMKRANFRFILIGLESVCQNTLNRLRKGIRVKDIEATCRSAKRAGLEPHLTIMVGYPWESKTDAEATVAFAKKMFRQGIIDSLQATIITPYPGTPVFEEAKDKGWLITEDWDAYDMKRPVWNSAVADKDVLRFTQGLYRGAMHPRFILRKISSVRNIDDIAFLFRAGVKVLGHLTDFSARDSSLTYK